MRHRRAIAVACVLACAGCSDRRDARELEREITALTESYQPLIDDLVARLQHLKHDIRDTMSGWENAFRMAQLANDAIGLQPFEQMVPPGPGFRNPPASLLGMGAAIRKHAAELASAGKTDELAALLARAEASTTSSTCYRRATTSTRSTTGWRTPARSCRSATPRTRRET